MKIIDTQIEGLKIIELEKREDERGFLARTFDQLDFAKQGINFTPREAYITHSLKKGTLRGFHVSIGGTGNAQLTRCTRGSYFQAVIDLRRSSPTFGKYQGFTFKAGDYKQLFVPEFVANSLLALEDDTEMANLYSQPFQVNNEFGIRYNDPYFKIVWPIPVDVVSEKDMSWSDFQPLNISTL